jgi:hypothetical protein
VARAKRTDRSEARRKYRAYLQAQEDAGIAEDEGSDSPADAGRKPSRRTQQDVQPVPGARLGIVGAAKGAYRTAHYYDDVKNIRELVFKSNAIWPIVIMCLVSGTYLGLRLRSSDWGSDPIIPILIQFIFIPPLIPPMLAGFFAPRATWLAGALASIMATVTLVVVLQVSSVTLPDVTNTNATTSPSSSQSAVAAASPSASTSPTVLATQSAAPSASPSASPSGSTTSTTGTTTSSDLLTSILIMLLQSLTIGAGIGALSGWYKRFLALSSGGPRKPPPSKSGSQRNGQRRRTATARK